MLRAGPSTEKRRSASRERHQSTQQDCFRAISSRYPSNLTDAEWKSIEPILITRARLTPRLEGRGGIRFRFEKHDPRKLLNAVFYLLKSEYQWRMLPKEFSSWQTVSYYFGKWRRLNLLQQIRPSGWPGLDSTGCSRGRMAQVQSQRGGNRYSIRRYCPTGRSWAGTRPTRPKQVGQGPKTACDRRYDWAFPWRARSSGKQSRRSDDPFYCNEFWERCLD